MEGHKWPWEERYLVLFNLFHGPKDRTIIKTLLWSHRSFSPTDFCLHSFSTPWTHSRHISSNSSTFEVLKANQISCSSLIPLNLLFDSRNLLALWHTAMMFQFSSFLVASLHSQSALWFTRVLPIIFLYIPSILTHPSSSILYIHNSCNFYDFPFAFLYPLIYSFNSYLLSTYSAPVTGHSGEQDQHKSYSQGAYVFVMGDGQCIDQPSPMRAKHTARQVGATAHLWFPVSGRPSSMVICLNCLWSALSPVPFGNYSDPSSCPNTFTITRSCPLVLPW